MVAKATQFDGLLEEASFALAESDVALRPTLDQLQFVYLLLSHGFFSLWYADKINDSKWQGIRILMELKNI